VYNCGYDECNNKGKDALDEKIAGPATPPPTEGKLKCYVNGEASKDCTEEEHICEVNTFPAILSVHNYYISLQVA
jgi:hypothetical protein